MVYTHTNERDSPVLREWGRSAPGLGDPLMAGGTAGSEVRDHEAKVWERGETLDVMHVGGCGVVAHRAHRVPH